MSRFETLLLLPVVAIALLLAGAWLAARLETVSPAERLAVALLAGLCVTIWNVSLLGAFGPIAAPRAWLCLWPLALSLLDRRTRRRLGADLVAVGGSRHGALAAVGAALFLGLLLAPRLARPDLVFYDGTSNHDAFFWISGAEHLSRQSYLVEPVRDTGQPFLQIVGVLIGWRPLWGRIAGEGLLALLSALVGASPLKLYLVATAALFLPWIAATYLLAKTFLVRRLSPLAVLGLVLLQPVFVFFHANANLPNLLGVLAGALLVVAVERSRAGPDRPIWLATVALALHALLCSYPELVPFVFLPLALLGWRLGQTRSISPDASTRRPLVPVTLALLAGLALNPLTTVRAWSGFWSSLTAARHLDQWANIFQSLGPLDLPAALTTLTVAARADFTALGSSLLSVLVLGALGVVLFRATDRFGTFAVLSGALLLLGYTLATDFAYGWQKAAQFGGLVTAALLPVAALSHFPARGAGVRIWVLRSVLGSVALLFAYATVRNDLGIYKWSRRKDLTHEWFDFRDYARAHFSGQTVLVDAPSFRFPFFHGMWAIYFLRDSHPVFSPRGKDNGGYLREFAVTEERPTTSLQRPVLVSAAWAASFDADSPRLFAGSAVALLGTANRVNALRGFSPENGVPEAASTQFSVAILPHRASELTFTLSPRSADDLPPFPPPRRWRLVVRSGGAVTHSVTVDGPPPWRFAAPLAAGREQTIEVVAEGPPAPPLQFPFAVSDLRVHATPDR